MAGLLSSIELSSRGLTVQRTKMNVVADNIANAETTETKEGGPYKRKRVIVKQDAIEGSFSSTLKSARTKLAGTNSKHLDGKSITVGRRQELSTAEPRVETDKESSFKLIHDPSHPDANEDGYVRMPDIEIVNEMVDMMAATRAYEANTVAIASAKKMAQDALDI